MSSSRVNPRLPAGRIRAWLELLRAPNLLTAPGDPWAGFALAAALSRWTAICWVGFLAVGMSALCLYAAGLVLNDVCDVARDSRERPTRPLPRGTIDASVAGHVAVGLLAAGIALAALAGRGAFCTALLVAVTVVAYNCWARAGRLRGAVTMGLCRGGSVLIGAVAGGGHAGALAAAAVVTVYIAVLTWIAAAETRRGPISAWRWALPACFAVLLLMGNLYLPGLVPSGRLILGLWLWTVGAGVAAWKSYGLGGGDVAPGTVQKAIGVYIHLLLLWQAGALIASGIGIACIAAGALLAAWPAARRLSRRFAPS